MTNHKPARAKLPVLAQLCKLIAARNLLLEGDPWSSRGAGPEGGEMGVDRC